MELGHSRPGLDPVLHACIRQVGPEVVSSSWPVPANQVSWGLPCPAHPKSRNVEEVCRFPELPARKPLTYQAKQLIAREVEVEKMRRVEASARARDSPQVSLSRPWAEQGPWRGHGPRCGPTQSTVTVCDFMQVDGGPGGPPGSSGEKELQPPAPCNHKQRLECILKRAALEEQVGADIPVGSHGAALGGLGRRLCSGLVLSPGVQLPAAQHDGSAWARFPPGQGAGTS